MRVKVSILLFCFSLILPSHAEPLSGINTEDFSKKASDAVVLQKNPFGSVAPKRGAISAPLRVSAIIHGEDNALALISGRIVKVGDRIGSARVIAIEEKKVVLKSKSGLLQLFIETKANR